MSAVTGRGDRRRRMLQDGRLAATEDATTHGEEQGTGKAPRYASDPASVSLGIAGRLLPTGPWSLAGVAVAAVAVIAGLVTADLYSTAITEALSAPVSPLLEMTSATSLAAWFTSALSLSIVVLCGVLFGLRRRRSDDVRGAYRWWIGAAAAALAASICLTTGLHQVIATAIASQVGWSPLAGDVFWWLAPALLTGGVIAVRVLLDLKESRLAFTAGILATVAGIIALCAARGWAPGQVLPYAAVIQVAALQAALAATLFAQLAYVRRIVLEAGGRVAAPARPQRTVSKATDEKKSASSRRKEKKEESLATTSQASQATKAPAAKTTATSRKAQAKTAPKPVAKSETEWIDGSQGDLEDNYEDGNQRRRLSKAERKRLRKQKARQQRAA